MKNYCVKKMMLAIVPFVILSQVIILPVMSISENTEYVTPLKIKILDTVKGQISEYEVNSETMKAFISLITEQKIGNSFGESVENKLEILENIGLLDSSTKNHINGLLNKIPNFENGQRFLPNSRAIFDLFNFFNGVLVGLKGQKDSSFLDLPVLDFPFINSTITALFSVYGQYSGEGFIFTLGTLGFRYIYDFDIDKYGFPFFPSIKGSLIGFTGIVLEAEVGDQLGEEYEGSYVVAAGMTIITAWNNV